jgi:hypothetical protein
VEEIHSEADSVLKRYSQYILGCTEDPPDVESRENLEENLTKMETELIVFIFFYFFINFVLKGRKRMY